MTHFRTERDSLGTVEVPADRYWGAQTQRSLTHFDISLDRFRWQRPMVRALGLIKQYAALVNCELQLLPAREGEAIQRAALEVAEGRWDEHFPLGVFQTGSGTHSNMNANEVIANRANEILDIPLGTLGSIHPNDHVNLCQSSNDVFPTAMHMAVLEALDTLLIPALKSLHEDLSNKSIQYKDVIKTGRTHLQDAAPVTVGQEFSAWAAQLEFALQCLESHCAYLYPVALGGTAVGTGLNAHPEFATRVVEKLQECTGRPFSSQANKFFALSSHEPLVEVSAALRSLSTALLKIVNDIRWLASGPRCGIGELFLPANEPGSSIMPGKVNPSQCEALSMVCAQVMGNDATVAFAGSQGSFQLNAYKPVIVHNVLESITLLSDGIKSFSRYCVMGIQVNVDVINAHLENNLMLATALNPHIGYEKSAEVAKNALKNQTSLKLSCMALGYASSEQFDQWVDLEMMVSSKEYFETLKQKP
ncbi:MAG: class II fumarate hydratase [Oleiphilus sp.]|nr:MAG: class II fumarate hydratase [Oleiphilus sp.]